MKKFNFNTLIWIIILEGFAIILYYLIASDKILLYIHPRMMKFIYFALVIFLILAVYEVNNLFKPKKNQGFRWGYILFFLPIYLLLLNPESMDASVLQNKSLSLIVKDSSTDTIINKDNEITGYDNNSQEILELLDESLETTDSNLGLIDSSQDTIDDNLGLLINPEEIVQDDFLQTLTDIYNQPEAYADREIKLDGFIFKQDTLSSDQFIIARLMITCCAADASVVGILCRYDEAEALPDDSWYSVYGTVTEGQYLNPYTNTEEIVYMLQVSYIEEIPAFDSPYVY